MVGQKPLRTCKRNLTFLREKISNMKLILIYTTALNRSNNIVDSKPWAKDSELPSCTRTLSYTPAKRLGANNDSPPFQRREKFRQKIFWGLSIFNPSTPGGGWAGAYIRNVSTTPPPRTSAHPFWSFFYKISSKR